MNFQLIQLDIVACGITLEYEHKVLWCHIPIPIPANSGLAHTSGDVKQLIVVFAPARKKLRITVNPN